MKNPWIAVVIAVGAVVLILIAVEYQCIVSPAANMLTCGFRLK